MRMLVQAEYKTTTKITVRGEEFLILRNQNGVSSGKALQTRLPRVSRDVEPEPSARHKLPSTDRLLRNKEAMYVCHYDL